MDSKLKFFLEKLLVLSLNLNIYLHLTVLNFHFLTLIRSTTVPNEYESGS